MFSLPGHRNNQDKLNSLSPHQRSFRWDTGCLEVKGFQHAFEVTAIACGVFSPNKRAKTLQVFGDWEQKKSSFELRKSLEKGLQTSSYKGNKKHLHWQLCTSCSVNSIARESKSLAPNALNMAASSDDTFCKLLPYKLCYFLNLKNHLLFSSRTILPCAWAGSLPMFLAESHKAGWQLG